MVKRLLSAACVALSAGAMMAPAAIAQDAGEFTSNVALTTDYVWRGVSQNSTNPAIQGGFDYANGTFYVGTWASIVDFGGANMELDLYGGFAGDFGNGVSWDVGVIGYLYPDADDLDFAEFYAGLGYETEAGLGLGGTVYLDPDNESVYVEGSVAYSINDTVGIDATIGSYDFDAGDDYVNYSLGATFAFEQVDLDLRFWGNDIDETGDADVDDTTEERVVLTLSRSF